MTNLTEETRAMHKATARYLSKTWTKRPESRLIFKKGKPVGLKAGPEKYPAAVTIHVDAKIDGKTRRFSVRMQDVTHLWALKGLDSNNYLK